MNIWSVIHWRVGGSRFKGQEEETCIICVTCLFSFFIIRISGCWHCRGAQRSSWVICHLERSRPCHLFFARPRLEESCHRAAPVVLSQVGDHLWGWWPTMVSVFSRMHSLSPTPGFLLCWGHAHSWSLDLIFTLWITEFPWNPSSPFKYFFYYYFFALFF